MTSPINNSRLGQAHSPMVRDMSQQQRVQRALEQLPVSNDAVKGAAAAANREDLLKATQRVNETLRSYNVQFELQEDSSRVITRIIDQDTGDVIRQIPAEDVLRIAERLGELQGLLISEEA